MSAGRRECAHWAVALQQHCRCDDMQQPQAPFLGEILLT